jgi:DNA-binding transcriptional ArsR family regulator
MPEQNPSLPLSAVQTALGSPTRWAILRELADGGSLMVSEVAKRTGLAPDAASKQLHRLIHDGIVMNPRGRLFEIKPQFLADKANQIVDFGYCLVRFGVGS